MTEAVEILETKEATEPTIFQKWLGRSKIYEIEVVMFGFAIALGNRNFFWNTGLANGYDTVWINTLIVGSGFICLSLCMGEMTSALPFSGGIFGFVRAASGPYYGFVVACFEVFFCLTIVVAITQYATVIPLVAGYIDVTFQSRLIGIFFGLNLFINLLGGSTFWLIVNMVGFLIFFLLLTYMFGTLLDVNKPEVDYKIFCKTDKPVEFDPLMFQLTSVLAQFQGLQYLPLLSELTVEPRKSIPRALVICSTTCLVFSICVSLAACSSLPGQFIVQLVPTPLMFGFQRILKVDFVESVWLNFPAVYASTLVFSYSSARQLYMIAKSGFLPSFFTYKTPQTGTPIVTLHITTAVGLGMAMMLQDYPDFLNPIIRMIDLCTYFVFLNAFVAYILFKKKYSSLPRDFRSPLGIWGAYIGIGINLLGVFAEFKYQNQQDILIAISVLLVLFGCVTIFYWVYLVRNQSFSEEEKKLMFKAYLINANREKRLRILRNNRVASASTAPKSQAQNKSLCSDTQSKTTDNNVTSPKDDDKHCELAQLPFKDHYLGIRQSETVESQNSQKLHHARSLSEKIVQFVSEKMNGMSPEALQEYERLAVLSSGGILDVSEEKVLAEESGMNDVEHQVVTTNE